MRTSITRDDDVAARIKRPERRRRRPFKELVDAALREGLERLDVAPGAPSDVRLRTLDLGASLVGSLDGVAEVVPLAEGPRRR